MNLVVYIATSFDGFIAREDGSLDWLPGSEPGDESSLPEPDSGPQEDYGFGSFNTSVDALILGRKSYEKVLSFGFWPYTDKRVIVLSSTLNEADSIVNGPIEFSQEAPLELVKRLESEGVKKVWVDGGATIRSYLEAGLINELIITRIPVLIGAGLSLFAGLKKDIHLKIISSTNYSNGVIQQVLSPIK